MLARYIDYRVLLCLDVRVKYCLHSQSFLIFPALHVETFEQKIVCGWIKAKSRVLWIFLLIADFIFFSKYSVPLSS